MLWARPLVVLGLVCTKNSVDQGTEFSKMGSVKKPQILIVCNSLPPVISGVGQYVYNTVKKLSNRYFFTILTLNATAGYDIEKNVNLQNSYEYLDFEIIRVRPLPPYAPYIRTYPLVLGALKILKKLDINLLHVHSFHQVHSDVLTVLAKKYNLPVVYSIHGWRNVENSFINPLLDIYEHLVAANVLKLADIITVLGKNSFRYIESIVKSDIKISIVPNGVDFYDIRKSLEGAKRHLYRKKGKNNIMYVGRLSRSKGILDLMRAFTLIRKVKAETFLTIIGDGPLRSTITDLINKYSLEDHVNVVGYVPNNQLVSNWLPEADVLALPSYGEGMPTVILEAMAVGVPVVASDVGDIRDVAVHEENCLLVKPGATKQLADYILEVIEDDVLRRRLISNGLKTAESHDWSIIAEKMDQIYREIL
jgi:glycosyltransferase involved in cell wall biosynthesis